MPAFFREEINLVIKFTIIFRIDKGDIITDKIEYTPDGGLGKVPLQQIPCKFHRLSSNFMVSCYNGKLSFYSSLKVDRIWFMKILSD